MADYGRLPLEPDMTSSLKGSNESDNNAWTTKTPNYDSCVLGDAQCPVNPEPHKEPFQLMMLVDLITWQRDGS